MLSNLLVSGLLWLFLFLPSFWVYMRVRYGIGTRWAEVKQECAYVIPCCRDCRRLINSVPFFLLSRVCRFEFPILCDMGCLCRLWLMYALQLSAGSLCPGGGGRAYFDTSWMDLGEYAALFSTLRA